ncbi:MAG: hypothetical protein R2823_08745 [Acidimicrobiia bacterium]
MDTAEQWNWVGLAFGATYISLVVFAASIAARINKAREKLGK